MVHAKKMPKLPPTTKKEAAQKTAETKASAQKIIESAKTTKKNADGTLMTRTQAAAWKRNYNNANNEGGDGYVPEVITCEDLEAANKNPWVKIKNQTERGGQSRRKGDLS